MTFTKSEIFKAAHREARRMECAGGPSYALRFAAALRRMLAATKRPKLVDVGYDSSLCHTLTRSQRDQLAA